MLFRVVEAPAPGVASIPPPVSVPVPDSDFHGFFVPHNGHPVHDEL